LQLKVSYGRKEGRPGYGSEQALVEIMLDVSEPTVSANPAALTDEIRRGFALCEAAVAEQLAQHAAEPAAETRPADRPDRGSGLPSQARPPSEPEPERQRPRQTPRGPTATHRPWNGRALPDCGRQLYAWSRREEEGGLHGFVRALVDMGKRQGFPPRLTEWDGPEIDAAIEFWNEYRDQSRAGQNGYQNGRVY
jgi:hypothetical protein